MAKSNVLVLLALLMGCTVQPSQQQNVLVEVKPAVSLPPLVLTSTVPADSSVDSMVADLNFASETLERKTKGIPMICGTSGYRYEASKPRRQIVIRLARMYERWIPINGYVERYYEYEVF